MVQFCLNGSGFDIYKGFVAKTIELKFDVDKSSIYAAFLSL